MTVKNVLPSMPGERKPTVGSVGGCIVVGSRDWKFQVSRPVDEFRFPFTATKRLVVGRRSTVVE